MITLTDSAATKVRQLIDQEGEDGLALRVAVRPGGCSGFSYEMFFDTDITADDLSSDFGGVKVVVDPSSAQLLAGAELDYKDGLEKSGFEINNPNAQKTCGCGQSFS
jgi:iron-sulfur cluster assembly protein/iron-sulfur cluster insertion protein